MDCLGSTFPSGSPCVPRDQLYFGDVTVQSAQISAFPQFSQIFIFFKFFLALRTIPARADRNVFHSTLSFPDESTLFLSLRKQSLELRRIFILMQEGVSISVQKSASSTQLCARMGMLNCISITKPQHGRFMQPPAPRKAIIINSSIKL